MVFFYKILFYFEVMNLPFTETFLHNCIAELGLPPLEQASIRDIVRLVNHLEMKSGIQFIRMEMGVPGLPPDAKGVDAEIGALKNGVASKYPPIVGIPDFKSQAAEFFRLYLNIHIHSDYFFPTTGAMQGALVSFLTVSRRYNKPTSTLFFDPGFPVQKIQQRILGLNYCSIDIDDARNNGFRYSIEEIIVRENVTSIVYSNPNNPTWLCLTEDELQVVGELADTHQIVVIEDLAYFGMDFREDYGHPGVAPYPPTIARYTSNYIILLSSSKIFSYAGQRIATMLISPEVYKARFPDLLRFFQTDKLGDAIVYGALYGTTAGTTHAAQYALADIFKEANTSTSNIYEPLFAYKERAKNTKAIFLQYGFHIVYDRDHHKPLADGFYYTLGYKKLSVEALVNRLLRCGIGAIGLYVTGSCRDGIRACVSQIKEHQYDWLHNRLKHFVTLG